MNKKIIAILCLPVIVLAARCSDCARAGQKSDIPSRDELQLQDYTIKNHDLVLTVCLAGNQCKHRAINNNIVNRPYYMDGEDFVLQFEGKNVNSSDMKVSKVEPGKNDLKFYMSFRQSAGGGGPGIPGPGFRELRAKNCFAPDDQRQKIPEIHPADRFARREAKARRPFPGRASRSIKRTAFSPWPTRFRARIFQAGKSESLTRSAGKSDRTGTQSYPAVIGVAEDGKVREYFFKYLDQVRHRQPKPYLIYNTWYDMPNTVNSRALSMPSRESRKTSLTLMASGWTRWCWMTDGTTIQPSGSSIPKNSRRESPR